MRWCPTAKVSIGNLRLFEHDDVPDAFRQQVARLEALGKTTMLVHADGASLGLLALADTPRPGTREVFARLASFGIGQAVMLTGDNEQVAKAVAQAVGTTDVRAELLPEDKLKVIDELMHKKQLVAMVGDGVNDAPAMARATLGIAMGGPELIAANGLGTAVNDCRLPCAIPPEVAQRRPPERTREAIDALDLPPVADARAWTP